MIGFRGMGIKLISSRLTSQRLYFIENVYDWQQKDYL